MKILLFMFLALMMLLIPGQYEINYQSKRIYKSIEKFWGIENPHLIEMHLPETDNGVNSIQGKFFQVEGAPSNSGLYYVYIGRVNSCRAGGCSIGPDPDFAYEMEYFDYAILYGPSMSVQHVVVFNYMATHGQEVSSKGWLKQFRGYNGRDSLVVGKNVDAITGATISVVGITNDLQEKTLLLHRFIERRR